MGLYCGSLRADAILHRAPVCFLCCVDLSQQQNLERFGDRPAALCLGRCGNFAVPIPPCQCLHERIAT
ncbi:hypothetical protein Pan14r_06010 [Crateriforma conspicua]|uniref:Uncharacterized protein n=1 Tax=Crateriforma conspicua TaxID=2527996 RepID=A0A5C5XYB3_9PLAN|nr:hypothetical protein Mal65_20080 [Crateriforma conspicua]TWT68357.1 hypothetical protein Pan14r_06010 [Crateriforma conspicua]